MLKANLFKALGVKQRRPNQIKKQKAKENKLSSGWKARAKRLHRI